MHRTERNRLELSKVSQSGGTVGSYSGLLFVLVLVHLSSSRPLVPVLRYSPTVRALPPHITS